MAVELLSFFNTPEINLISLSPAFSLAAAYCLVCNFFFTTGAFLTHFYFVQFNLLHEEEWAF